MGLFLQGLTLGLAYTAPIGMQNLFVINSALTKPRRRALLTALIVLVFDVSLSLSCFFGIGKLMQRYDPLRLGVLAVGGLVVLHIGAELLFARKHGQSSDNIAQSRNTAHQVASRFGGDNELLSTIITAGVVTWLNPQAIIDGTLMLGAFSATLTMSQSTPFITGVEIASALWFIGLTLLISVFSHKFSPIVTAMNRVCGAVVVLYGVKLLADFVMAVL
ncbi:MAG: LysE/ArgO family amino acid transporter [Bifidobacterium dentium]